MLELSWLLPLAIISGDECSKKRKKERERILGNKKGQVPGTSKEKKK